MWYRYKMSRQRFFLKPTYPSMDKMFALYWAVKNSFFLLSSKNGIEATSWLLSHKLMTKRGGFTNTVYYQAKGTTTTKLRVKNRTARSKENGHFFSTPTV
jgi:hypothetical protein